MERKIIMYIILAWVFFPVVSVTVFYSYCLCWIFYLLYAQTDAPQSQSRVPLNPVRVYRVTSYLLTCLYEHLTGPFIPSILQYGWLKLSSEGKKKPSVRKNIRYGTKPRNRLDVYLPDYASATVSKNSKGLGHSALTSNPNQQQNDNPVIILIATSWNSGNKETCMPAADNLQSQGYVVVVPDISLYPTGKVADMVEDIQRCVYWTHTHIRSFRGDPSQIYLMGHGAGSLLSALTIIHDACSTLNVLPPSNSSIKKIPLWDNNTRRTGLPRVHGLILFSGVYDITYYYAYLYKQGLEQVHALPRVMGNNSDAFKECSPAYLLNNALSKVGDREQLKKLLPRKVLLIHGDQDTFNPVTTTLNFCSLLESTGIPSVQLSVYDNIKHISPKIDLIVPTRPLCVSLLKDIRKCCKGVVVGSQFKEKSEEIINKDKIRSSRRKMSQVRH